jgi:predicted nucleic acid-binding protein
VAWDIVLNWTKSKNVWILSATEQHANVMAILIRDYKINANLISDTHLVALAIQHGLTIASADSDFAIFNKNIKWHNPLNN